jgi:hypothetical protein
VIVLPNEGTTLDTLETSMFTQDIGALQLQAKAEWQMQVYIPEIALEITIDLNEPLKQVI